MSEIKTFDDFQSKKIKVTPNNEFKCNNIEFISDGLGNGEHFFHQEETEDEYELFVNCKTGVGIMIMEDNTEEVEEYEEGDEEADDGEEEYEEEPREKVEEDFSKDHGSTTTKKQHKSDGDERYS